MNFIILLLAAVAFVVVAVMTVTGPLLPLIAGEFSRSVGQAGIIVTAFAVPYGAFQIVFGPIGDRYGKLRVVATLAAGDAPWVLCLNPDCAPAPDFVAAFGWMSRPLLAGTGSMMTAAISEPRASKSSARR